MPKSFSSLHVFWSAVAALTTLAACGTAPSQPAATEATTPAAASSSTAAFRCGTQGLSVRFEGDVAQVRLADDYILTLHRAIAASGARYVGPGPTKTEFWTKGNWAMLTVNDTEYPHCLSVPNDDGAALQGGEWSVESFDAQALVENSRITLSFDAEGRLHGQSSCNRYGGSYAVAGEIVTVSQLISTMMACAPALMTQEQRYLTLLREVREYAVAADGALVLSTQEGRQIVARRP